MTARSEPQTLFDVTKFSYIGSADSGDWIKFSNVDPIKDLIPDADLTPYTGKPSVIFTVKEA